VHKPNTRRKERWANIKRDRNGIIFDDSRNLRGTASTGVGVH